MTAQVGTAVDVVVVSYNSRAQLRACIEPLLEMPEAHVIVVDNASPDGSLDVVRELPVSAIQRSSNGGFATGVNAGWQRGLGSVRAALEP